MRALLPKKGQKSSPDIEQILENFKKLLKSKLSEAKSQVEVDIIIAEVISSFKKMVADLNYKIEALIQIISKFIQKNKFEEALETHSLYETKLINLFEEIDAAIKKIYVEYFENIGELTSTQQLYLKRFVDFENEWKTQKDKFPPRHIPKAPKSPYLAHL